MRILIYFLMVYVLLVAGCTSTVYTPQANITDLTNPEIGYEDSEDVNEVQIPLSSNLIFPDVSIYERVNNTPFLAGASVRNSVSSEKILKMNANSVILSPYWNYENVNNTVIRTGGTDIEEFQQFVHELRSKGLDVILILDSEFEIPEDKTKEWLDSYTEEKKTFLKIFSLIAEQENVYAVSAVRTGDISVYEVGCYNCSIVLARERVNDQIASVKRIYNGNIILETDLSHSREMNIINSSYIDFLFFRMNKSLTNRLNNPSIIQLEEGVRSLTKGTLKQIHEETGIPVIVEISYSSMDGGNYKNTGSVQDLEEQVDIMNAFMNIISETDWITGFYVPFDNVEDKPAFLQLSRWFSII